MAGTIRPCGRILVVDDDRGVRLLLRDTLVRAGFDVTTVADGDDALASFPAAGRTWSCST